MMERDITHFHPTRNMPFFYNPYFEFFKLIYRSVVET